MIDTVLMLFLFVMAVLLLYWAVLFRVEEKMSALTVHVVDFDGQAPYDDVDPFIGPMVTQMALETNNLDRPTLGFSVLPAADFNNDPIAVRQSVYDEHCFAAIIVNANASSLLLSAIMNGNTSYDPTGAIHFILLSARDETAYSNYIYPQLQTFSDTLMSRFGTLWTQSLAGSSSVTKDMLARAPSAVNPGIAPLRIDLRPFGPPTATPSVTIGLIYLIIMAFFSFAFFFPIHQVSTIVLTKSVGQNLMMLAAICDTRRPSPPSLLAIHPLALASHHRLVHFHLPSLLPRLPLVPDPVRETPRLADRGGLQRQRLRPRLLPRLLDDQLCRHAGPGPGVGERDHDHRPALDRPLAHLLGHHQRRHGLLHPRPGPRLLPLGLRLAAVQHCPGQPHRAL
jgi:hypothetical protein